MAASSDDGSVDDSLHGRIRGMFVIWIETNRKQCDEIHLGEEDGGEEQGQAVLALLRDDRDGDVSQNSRRRRPHDREHLQYSGKPDWWMK